MSTPEFLHFEQTRPLSEHRMIDGIDLHIYAGDTGDPGVDQLRLSFVNGHLTANVDLDPKRFIMFRRMLDNVWEELFEKRPHIQCPACGYTQDDANMHGDHRVCRMYPFFPGEKGKSQAKSI